MFMENILFLMVIPLVFAGLVLIVRHPVWQQILTVVASALLIGCTVLTVAQFYNYPNVFYLVDSEIINLAMIAIEVLLSGYLVYIGYKKKRLLVSLFAIVQIGAMLWFEFGGSHSSESASHHLFIDKLNLMMIAIIAIVGSLIIVYTVPYMRKHHHHHPEQPDRTPQFLALLFVFLTAMFGLVVSNDLVWIFFFWELTTLISYLLIRYPDSQEAHNNALRALVLNMLGGVCFVGAIVFLGIKYGATELDTVLNLVGKADLIVPATLLAIAGLTKSAQMPFSRWLLGAMVAPTPSSALLHSSTMVKAGVYLLIRISPMLVGTNAGLMVIIVGGVTFLMTSLLAISQSDAKKVLAYSTIANLGLIVICAGIGTYESLWAAAMLILFHAVSKSLLFLSVGTTEQALGSRDIEDMHGLIVKEPSLGLVMVIGIAGMFLAPFGMLIAKWAALRAFIDSGHLFVVMLLVYGSAATLMYWTKWLSRLVAVLHHESSLNNPIAFLEWVPLYFLSFLVLVLCVSFPQVSTFIVIPFLADMFKVPPVDIISGGNQIIMLMMLGMIAILPFGLRLFSKMDDKITTVYMSGINRGDNRNYTNSMGGESKVFLSNWYLSRYFGEKMLLMNTVYLMAAFMMIMSIYLIGGGLWR
jgi:ech hydrogenase subunit A